MQDTKQRKRAHGGRRRRQIGVIVAVAAVIVTLMVPRSSGGEQIQLEAKTVSGTIEQEAAGAEQEVKDEDPYGVLEYLPETMSEDWSAEELEGFCYHEISEDAKAAGGTMPVVIQAYTYVVCQKYGVDYEMVFALIEKESMCRWDVVGDDGESTGYMQIQEKWHKERMERLGVDDLTDPFQNILVGVDILTELQEKTGGDNMDTLAAYNYGLYGAEQNLWSKGIRAYSYNTAIMERAQELKEEKAAAGGDGK